MNTLKMIRKKIVGPLYRKTIKQILWKYKNKKIANRKIEKENYAGFEKFILIGFLQIHNENQKGNLKRILKHMVTFCDDIVVYDDGSTDNSCEVASLYTKHIIKSDKNNFIDELEHKQKLLDLAISLKPDWIVWLDADEIFDRHGELNGIRELCMYGTKNEVDGFSFQEINLWKKINAYRVDEAWAKYWAVRLWKNNGKLKFLQEKGLHRQIYPQGLKKILRSEIKVIHYGFSSEEKIKQKYEIYKSLGLTGNSLNRIIDERGIKLKKFSQDWFPPSIKECYY